jgi:hypothetical protein
MATSRCSIQSSAAVAGVGGGPVRARRKYVPVGSAAASLRRKARPGPPPTPADTLAARQSGKASSPTASGTEQQAPSSWAGDNQGHSEQTPYSRSSSIQAGCSRYVTPVEPGTPCRAGWAALPAGHSAAGMRPYSLQGCTCGVPGRQCRPVSLTTARQNPAKLQSSPAFTSRSMFCSWRWRNVSRSGGSITLPSFSRKLPWWNEKPA